MFDKLMENIDDYAVRLGLPADKLRALGESLQGGLAGGGGDPLSALMTAAREHGLSADKIQALLGELGGADGLLDKVKGLVDRDGDGNPVNDLMGMAKGLFSKD